MNTFRPPVPLKVALTLNVPFGRVWKLAVPPLLVKVIDSAVLSLMENIIEAETPLPSAAVAVTVSLKLSFKNLTKPVLLTVMALVLLLFQVTFLLAAFSGYTFT